MNKLSLTLSMFLMIYLSAFAQHNLTPIAQQQYSRYLSGTQQADAAQSNMSRLIARRTDTIIGTGTANRDSSTLSYSGTRGGDDNMTGSQFNYDLQTALHNSGSGWTGTTRTTQTFDASNRLLTAITETYSGGSWTGTNKYLHIYDANGHAITDTTYTWQAGAWQAQYADSTIYSPQGLLLYSISSYISAGVVTYAYRLNFTYNAAGKQTSEIQTINNGSGWTNSTAFTDGYDANNNNIYADASQWVSGAWQYQSRDSFGYDAANRQIYYLFQSFNGVGFENSSRQLNRYDNAGGKTSVLNQSWSGGVWKTTTLDSSSFDVNHNPSFDYTLGYDSASASFYNEYKYTHFYNASGQNITDTFLIWTSGAWVYNSLNNYGYDGSGNRTLSASLNWNAGAWGRDYDTKQEYTYNTYKQYETKVMSYWLSGAYTPIYNYYWWYELYQGPAGIADVRTIASSVYPNPFSHTFTVAFESQASGEATVKLYDLSGKLLTRTQSSVTPGSNSITWDGGIALPKGMYIYELSAGNAVSRGKIVAQ